MASASRPSTLDNAVMITGTIWHFVCPCGREHEYRRQVVPVEVAEAHALEAERAAAHEHKQCPACGLWAICEPRT